MKYYFPATSIAGDVAGKREKVMQQPPTMNYGLSKPLVRRPDGGGDS